MLVRAELNESQLRNIFNRYNTCGPGQPAAKQLTTRATTVRIGLLAGAQRATSELSDDGEIALTSRFRPVAGIGLTVHPASFSPALTLRLEALYQTQLHESEPYTRISFSALKTTRTPQIKLTTLRVPLLLRYALPTRSLRPYVQAGVEVAILLDTHQALVISTEEQLNRSSYMTTTYELAVRKLGYGPTGALGLLIPTGTVGSIQFEVRYNYLDNTSQSADVIGGARTLSLLAGYNFGH
nr:outer membrane beta-barrel protein [Hymenobacter cyanobacteriorum]